METTCLVMLLYLIWTGSMMGGTSCGDYLPGYVVVFDMDRVHDGWYFVWRLPAWLCCCI